ncbi:MAG: hypothetical protein LBM12_00425 [Candidatus Nomurabacteria bacterium]|jgi:hypothetical protein|nr:hypothetical protein [Candidatus Nomurabacteria bacterium]
MKNKAINVNTASRWFRAELRRRLELAKDSKNHLNKTQAKKIFYERLKSLGYAHLCR